MKGGNLHWLQELYRELTRLEAYQYAQGTFTLVDSREARRQVDSTSGDTLGKSYGIQQLGHGILRSPLVRR